jgi:hypothetical protein
MPVIGSENQCQVYPAMELSSKLIAFLKGSWANSTINP